MAEHLTFNQRVRGSNPLRVTILCGCSSMVELQPSKLTTWVRFPSPAPIYEQVNLRIDFFCTCKLFFYRSAKLARSNRNDKAIFEYEQEISEDAVAIDAKKVFADLEKITLNKYDVKINARSVNSWHNGVNLRSWLFFIALFPTMSVYLYECS